MGIRCLDLKSLDLEESETELRYQEFEKQIDDLLKSEFGSIDVKEEGMLNQCIWFRENYKVSGFCIGPLYSITIEPLSQGKNFRVARWGDSKQSVMEKEGKANQLEDDKDTYAFDDVVADLECYVFYYFTEDKLTHTAYSFIQSNDDKNTSVSDFNTLVSLLCKKYGEPLQSDMDWIDSRYKNKPTKYGLAVSLGHLTYTTAWQTKTEEIFIKLTSSSNNTISLLLMYKSIKYKQFTEEVEESEILDDL